MSENILRWISFKYKSGSIFLDNQQMLYSESTADATIYHFAATSDTLGDYSLKLLAGATDGDGVSLDTVSGTMTISKDGVIQKKEIDIIYTVAQAEDEECFHMHSTAEFKTVGDNVYITFPNLSKYKQKKEEAPAVTITPIDRTLYTTADVNVRAAGNLSSVVLGGLPAGSALRQTGYTSDGWVQFQFNGQTAYIWSEFTSTTKPVKTTNSSGIMYATAPVNVRASHSSDSSILGTLSKRDAVEITGTTDNGWTRVNYKGQTGYVFSDYLSWTQPKPDNYVENAMIEGFVLDSSYGTLVIQPVSGGPQMVFDTTYANIHVRDNIYTDDIVEVIYSGAGNPYTASVVNDYTSHTMDQKVSVYREGIIREYDGKKMKMNCADGLERTFIIDQYTEITTSQELQEGIIVGVYWMSATDGNDTKNIEAMRIID